MRKFILPAFAVATVAILAGAAVAEGPGGAASSPRAHGSATTLRAPYGGPPGAGAPSQTQIQVFGDLAGARQVRPIGASGPVQTLPRFPGAHGLHNRGAALPSR